MSRRTLISIVFGLALLGGARACATEAQTATYKKVDGHTLQLDLYLPAQAAGLVPTVFYIHGGAWAHGSKSSELAYLDPWMARGWAVVSVDYRLSGEARAPAAVEDCVSALRWTAQHAGQYHLDLNRLVISGASAGGNLALLVAMAPPSAGFDRDRAGGALPKAVAVVNIAGIADVADLVSGPNRRQFALDWVGGAGQMALARRVSPLTYVRPGLPPVLTIQGDADPVVPYEQSIRLGAALQQAGVFSQLLTIPGGKHGGWRPVDYQRMAAAEEAFLARRN